MVERNRRISIATIFFVVSLVATFAPGAWANTGLAWANTGLLPAFGPGQPTPPMLRAPLPTTEAATIKGPGDTKSTKSDTRIPNHYIVVLKESVERPGVVANAQIEQQDGEIGFVYGAAVKGYSAELSKAAVEALRRDPRVKYVTPDHEVETTSQTLPSGIQRIRAIENATADIDGENDAPVNVDVAVIDTGISNTHPDLNVVARTDCSAKGETVTCVDNTGDDSVGHGTHVAGTIGAIDNSIGVVGVAPGARLWAVKVFGSTGSTAESNIIAGVNWVKSHAGEIETANMSLSCAFCKLPALDEAIAKTVEAGVAIVVAAGNEDLDAKYANPANHPDVITVSALADYDGEPGGKSQALLNSGSEACSAAHATQNYGEDDVLAWFSNRGKTIDVAAPGVCILSTVPGGGYGFGNGTSMAAPHVTGVAALLASESNPADKEDVEAIRQQITDEGSQNWNDIYLWNSVDLAQVLPGPLYWEDDGVQEPLVDPGKPGASRYVTRSTGISLTGGTLNGGVNPGGSATEYQFEYGTSASYGSKSPSSATSVGAGVKDLKVSTAVSGLTPDTTYHFRLVTTSGGKTTHSEDRTFKTLPAVVTRSPKDITRRRALLAAAVNPLGVNSTYQFQWGETTEYGKTVPASPKGIGSGSAFVGVDEWIEGLTPNTTYHYRVVVTTAQEKTIYGADVEVTTAKAGLVAEEYPVFLSTKPYGSYALELGFRDNSARCFGTHYEQELTGPAETLEFELQEAEQCQTDEEVPTEIEMNGCHLVFYPGDPTKILPGDPTGAMFQGTADIACPEGKEIVVPPEPTPAQPEPCEVTIPSQEGLRALLRTRNTLDVFIDSGGGLEYNQASGAGITCPAEGTFQDGYMWGGWEASALNEEEDPIDVEFVNSPATLEAKTTGATEVTHNSATVNGTVNPEGIATSYYFEYGKTASYGTKVPASPQSIGSGTSNVKVSEMLTGLEIGASYHYRVVAVNVAGTSYGKDRTFVLNGLPTATTEAATNLKPNSATLNGTVNPKGNATSYYFEYGKTTSYGAKVPIGAKSIGSGTSGVSVSEGISGLEFAASYHYRVVAEGAGQKIYGTDKTLTTAISIPIFALNLGSNGSGNGQFSAGSIGDVAVDAGGNVWVSNMYRVQKFNSKGEYLSQFGSKGTGNGQFLWAKSLDIDSEGNIWVADETNCRLQRFNAKGEFLKRVDIEVEVGEEEQEICPASDVAVDPKDNVWLLSTYDASVRKFDPEGNLVTQASLKNSSSNALSYPLSIVADANEDIMVTSANSVFKFDSEGEYLGVFGSAGSGNGQFFDTYGIDVDSNHNIWVAEWSNIRVQGFNLKGEYLTKFGSSGSGNGQFGPPSKLAVGPDGAIWVYDGDHSRVVKFVQ